MHLNILFSYIFQCHHKSFGYIYCIKIFRNHCGKKQESFEIVKQKLTNLYVFIHVVIFFRFIQNQLGGKIYFIKSKESMKQEIPKILKAKLLRYIP